MTFRLKPLRLADASAIGSWRYQPPYDVYDLERFPLYAAVVLRWWNTLWGYEVYGVWGDEGDLVGTFMFTRADKGGVTLGLALRPDLTGKGLGLAFMQAGVDFARQRFSPTFLRLDVAEFNLRAIKVYERAGFQLGKRTFHWKAWHREMRRDP